VNKRYRQARFLLSTPDNRRAPADEGAEVAFAGRSNAGKSSALNAITSQRSLARTSKTPGRTQLINFFALDDQTRLVDLPGYGYAKVSRSLKNEWIRHPLKEFDRQLLAWCHQAQLACHVLLTKSDKLKRGPAKAALLQVSKQLGEYHPEATVQLFSAKTPIGLDEVHAVLDQWLMLDEDPDQ